LGMASKGVRVAAGGVMHAIKIITRADALHSIALITYLQQT
jgi:hypothetical protein